jgi:hypothetical protein
MTMTTTTRTLPLTRTQPLVIHEVTGAARTRRRVSDAYELRPVTLTAAAYLMGTSVASFDAVRQAAAEGDLVCCPLCKDHRRRRSPNA